MSLHSFGAGGPSGGGGTGAVLAATNYDYNVEVYTPGVTDVQVVNGGSPRNSFRASLVS